MILFREAGPGDFDGVLRLYRQLLPEDPVLRDGSDAAAFERILGSLRGSGLGKQIMAGTLRAAWEAGCYKAMLMTGSRRPATHAFYRACGFSPDAKAYLARPS